MPHYIALIDLTKVFVLVSRSAPSGLLMNIDCPPQLRALDTLIQFHDMHSILQYGMVNGLQKLQSPCSCLQGIELTIGHWKAQAFFVSSRDKTDLFCFPSSYLYLLACRALFVCSIVKVPQILRTKLINLYYRDIKRPLAVWTMILKSDSETLILIGLSCHQNDRFIISLLDDFKDASNI